MVLDACPEGNRQRASHTGTRPRREDLGITRPTADASNDRRVSGARPNPSEIDPVLARVEVEHRKTKPAVLVLKRRCDSRIVRGKAHVAVDVVTTKNVPSLSVSADSIRTGVDARIEQW